MAAFNRVSAEAAGDSTLVRKLTIVNNVDEAATLTNIRSSNPMFKAEVTELEPGKKFELTVSMMPPFHSGNNNGSIEISTGLKEMPELKVQARVYITADVDVMPAKLVLREGRTELMNRQLSVKNHSSKPLEVTNLQASNPLIKATLLESVTGQQYKIAVEIPVEYDPPQSGDKITFNTNNSTIPTVEIPIQGISKRNQKGPPQRANRPVQSMSLPKGGRRMPSAQQAGGRLTPAARKVSDHAAQAPEKPAAAKDAKAATKGVEQAKPSPGDPKTDGEKK